MKRLLPMLLGLALALSACTGGAQDDTLALNFSDAPSQTETDSAPPPVDPQTTTEPVTLPSGLHVTTDWSKYSPRTQAKAKYTRISEDFVADFHPMDDLGRVYPYAAAPLFSNYEDGYSWLAGYRWGLIDRSGRILTDGTYENIQPLGDIYGPPGYHPVAPPLWQVSRVIDVVPQTYDDSQGNEYTYYDGKTVYGVIAMDGSFATGCVFSNVQPMGSSYFLAVRDWDKRDMVVCDLSGTPMFTGKVIPSKAEWWYLDYGDDLFLLTLGRSGEQTECRYLDSTGKTVLGPYAKASPFCEGLASASPDGENWGFVDKTGQWVVPPTYDFCEDFSDGRAVCSDGSTYMLIDQTGRELLRLACSGLNRDYGLLRAELWVDGTLYDRFYDLDGTLVASLPGSDWYLLDELTACRSTGQRLLLQSLRAPYDPLELTGTDYAVRGMAWVGDRAVPGYWCESAGSGELRFLSLDLKELTVSAPANADEYYDCWRTTTDVVTAAHYDLVHDGKVWHLLDADGQERGVITGGEFTLCDGLVRSIDDYGCTYCDLAGNVVFRYPLKTAMDD